MQLQTYESSPDTSPWALLYQKHAPAIFAYLRLHTPTREEAEDLLLEVFIAALENEQLCERKEPVQRAWLRSVARNKLVDRYRSVSHKKTVSFQDVIEPLYETEESSPEQTALKREESDQVRQMLHHLPILQQQVLHLRFVYGLRSSDIASIVGKKDGTVRMLISRALVTLRSIYGQSQEQEKKL
jgi:RNA polymerase sigma factor (sigma-70 family)